MLPDRFNPASRVAHALEAAYDKSNDDTPVIEVWSTVFGIEGTNQHKKAREVNKALELVSDEIDLVSEQVDSGAAGAPERYAEALRNARTVTGVIDFSPPFQQSKRSIRSQDLNLLGLISDLTPDEERVDDEALSDITEILEELRDYAVEYLEGAFQAFILRQVRIIEEAIRRYPIIGVKAFNDGANASFANLVQNQEILREATDEEAKTRLKELLGRFFKLAPEWVVRAAQVINAADTIREITGN
jgi:hypothetical protein